MALGGLKHKTIATQKRKFWIVKLIVPLAISGIFVLINFITDNWTRLTRENSN